MGDAPLPGDFRVIVYLTPPQMNGFCDLFANLDAPVSKIASVKIFCIKILMHIVKPAEDLKSNESM